MAPYEMAHHMSLRNDKRYYPMDHGSRKCKRRDSPSAISSAQHAFTHNTRAPFLRLPRELREQIYEYVWTTENDFLFRYRGINILARRPDVDTWLLLHTYGLPSWLLASQAILHDGIETLHRKREFLSVNDLRLECELDGYPLRKPHSNNPLLFNDQIRTVGFYRERQGAWVRGTHENSHTALYWAPTREQERFLSHLRRVGAKNLHFHMQFSHTAELVVHAKQHPKLKTFHVPPGMCKKVDIDMGMYVANIPAAPLREKLLRETRKAVRRAAAEMVGGEVFVTEVQWKTTTIKSRLSEISLAVMPSFRCERSERG